MWIGISLSGKDEEYRMTDICILTNQNLSAKLNFWDKLKYIWKIWWTGIAYTDQIVLNKEELIN